MRSFQLVIVALLALPGCDSDWLSGPRSDGLRETVRSGGPRVVFDVLAKPLPEIPLPNDQATRLDPSSVTGRRLNVSLDASTEYERRARREFNKLPGFGTYAPIWTSFDAPLDLADLIERHSDNDFRNDAVYVLNVDPSCSRYGEEVGLDMGRGRFPITLFKRDGMTFDPNAPDGYVVNTRNTLFDLDHNGTLNNYLFPERNEPDLNDDGVLNPSEDLDHDGVRDVANFLDPSACDESTPTACVARCDDDVCFQDCLTEHDRCVADNLLTFYERETNTLIMRPIWPLEQRCRYAAVLTTRLTGESGNPVESPFAAVNSRSQTGALAPVPELLQRYGLSVDDVAFAWTFTTGDMTGDLENLRAGLYGAGPWSNLGEEFPSTSLDVWTLGSLDGTDNEAQVLNGACSGGAITLYWNIGVEEAETCALESDGASIGGVFSGSFEAPYLLQDDDDAATDQYPNDHDEVWRFDPKTGAPAYGRGRVTFWCSLPRKADDCTPGNPEGAPFCPPYPMAIYAHGYGGSRNEMTNFMGRHAAMGQALCGLDGPGHGANWMDYDPRTVEAFQIGEGFFLQYKAKAMKEMLTRGRDRDLNNDGTPDPGADMWTADLFHTRDMVRQSVLEHIQFVRILRSLGTESGPSGDFDGDGEVDIGGPNGVVSMWGISLGGVISGVMAGAEPGLDAVSPNAGGAGLVDVGVRSAQAGVPQAVWLPIVGPTIVGCIPTDEHQNPIAADEMVEDNCLRHGVEMVSGETMRFGFLLNDVSNLRRLPIGRVQGVRVGDRIVLDNLDNGESDTATVGPRGRIRMAVAADAVDPIARRSILGISDGQSAPAGDPTRLGDRLRIRIFDGQTDTVKAELDTWGQDSEFQKTIYEEGTTLVAPQEGFGIARNTPRFRRFSGLAQSALSMADPGVWAAHSHLQPLQFPYDPHGRTVGGSTRTLMMPTAGDWQVPASTGVAMARVGGLFGSWLRDPERSPETGWRELFEVDERWGKSIDEYLVDTYAVEGDGRFARHADNPLHPFTVYDVDNVSDGEALFSCGDSDWSSRNGESGCPDSVRGTGPECDEERPCERAGALCVDGRCEVFISLPRPETGGLRLNVERDAGRYDSFRLPVLRPAGQHGIYNSQTFRVFDADTFMVNFTVRYLGSAGQRVEHEMGLLADEQACRAECEADGQAPEACRATCSTEAMTGFEAACDCSASQLGQITINGTRQNPALLLRQLDPTCRPENLKICNERCTEAWGFRTPAESVCEPSR